MSETAVTRLLQQAADAAKEQDADPLLRMTDIAALTSVPIDTLRYWRHLGSGPPMFRLGRRVVARRSQVLAWIAEREAAARPRQLAD